MLNQNYRLFVGGALNGENVTLNVYEGSGLDRTFPAKAWQTYGPSTYTWSGSYSVYRIGLVLGRGTSKPTESDIQLEDEITLSHVTGSMVSGTSSYVKLISATYKNNNSETVVVNEVGVVLNDTNSNGNALALIGRIVLDTPVVMNPGDSYTFSYAIE